MDYDKKLSDLKEVLLTLIKTAASKNDSSGVVMHSKFLEEVETHIQKMHAISSKIIDIENRIGQRSGRIGFREKKISIGVQISAKAKGKIRRDIFLRSLEQEGIYLTQVKGILYRSQNSRLIGIASSSEKKEGDRWFSGLPPERYETIVLLCEKTIDSFYSFVFPQAFVNEHLDDFSRDSKNQIKFNVLRDNDKFFLTIPGKGNVNISKYLDKYKSI